MTKPSPIKPAELALPMFWPIAAATALFGAEMDLAGRNLKFMAEEAKISGIAKPQFATPNTVRLNLRTLILRDYSGEEAKGLPTLVDAPYAGHSSVIADYADGQSLMQTLKANGVTNLFLTDWKSATPDMKDLEVDQYLAELNVCVDDLGGRVNLVGLCQGGWMAAMFAARFPAKVASLVLAGAPIDANAGDGPIKQMAKDTPISLYEDLVAQGGGLMPGRFMLAGWKGMHPDEQYVQKHIDLYEHIDDPAFLKKTELFERWYENPIDLPGRWYLQVIQSIFKDNLLAKGKFVGLGRTLNLKTITCPVYLLAGESDDITPHEQVFAGEALLGTPSAQIVKRLTPGGHIGLFMGSSTLREVWPTIAKWISAAR
jgi:poly(3-hydroxybutyrate) depolymerase